jgi:hypothetical protein
MKLVALLSVVLFASSAAGKDAPKVCVQPPPVYEKLGLAGCAPDPTDSKATMCLYPFAFRDSIKVWTCAVMLVQHGCTQGFVPEKILCFPNEPVASNP